MEREMSNLNKFGYKEVIIQGDEFLVYWHRDSLTPTIYKGTTSYSYEENGEQRLKNSSLEMKIKRLLGKIW